MSSLGLFFLTPSSPSLSSVSPLGLTLPRSSFPVSTYNYPVLSSSFSGDLLTQQTLQVIYSPEEENMPPFFSSDIDEWDREYLQAPVPDEVQLSIRPLRAPRIPELSASFEDKLCSDESEPSPCISFLGEVHTNDALVSAIELSSQSIVAPPPSPEPEVEGCLVDDCSCASLDEDGNIDVCDELPLFHVFGHEADSTLTPSSQLESGSPRLPMSVAGARARSLSSNFHGSVERFSLLSPPSTTLPSFSSSTSRGASLASLTSKSTSVGDLPSFALTSQAWCSSSDVITNDGVVASCEDVVDDELSEAGPHEAHANPLIPWLPSHPSNLSSQLLAFPNNE